MNEKTDVSQLLENLSENIESEIDNRVYDFFRKNNGDILKKIDVYCFRPKIACLFKIYGYDENDAIDVIIPMPNSNRAVWISLVRSFTQTDTESVLGIKILNYSVNVTEFDLSETAGDPADLMVLRGEKILIDPVAGETPETVRRNGILKNRKNIFQRYYTLKLHRHKTVKLMTELLDWFSGRKPKTGAIIKELENFWRDSQLIMKNPNLNHFTSKKAINY